MKINICFLLLLGLVAIVQCSSCIDKKAIVDHHNNLRKLVANGEVQNQPKAANMQKLVWDDELGNIAQKWADRQVFEHSSATHPRFSVGENLYISMTSVFSDNSVNWVKAIDSWFGENKDYQYPDASSDNTGHYTQVVWANTQYIGCGVSQYREGKWLKKLYVCNYGPAGNYEGEKPYNTGSGCENLCCSTQDCNNLYGNQC